VCYFEDIEIWSYHPCIDSTALVTCSLFGLLLLVYKALNGMAPLYITELLSYCTCSGTLRSTDQKLLAVPKSRLKT